MGAGVGAVAGIENEPSPRRAAIENAQAELRWEVAVRNERRRELEFLERGGNPLDFKFGETTGRPAEQIVPSDGKSKHSPHNLANGDLGENSCENGLYFKKAFDIAGKLCLDESDAATNSSESTRADAFPTCVSSLAEHDQAEASKHVSDCPKAVKIGLKSQYARRNRQRSNRFGIGYSATKDPEKGGVEDGSPKYSVVGGSLRLDAEAGDVASGREKNVKEDVDSLPSGNTDAVPGVGEGFMLKVATAATDHSEFDATRAIGEASLLQNSKKADITGMVEQNEDTQSLERLLLSSIVSREAKRKAFLAVDSTVSQSAGFTKDDVKVSQQASYGDKESMRGFLDRDKESAEISNGGIVGVDRLSKVDGEEKHLLNIAQDVGKGLTKQNGNNLDSCVLQNADGTTASYIKSHSSGRHSSSDNPGAVKISISTLEPVFDSNILEGKVGTVGPSCTANKSIKDNLLEKTLVFDEIKVKVEEGISERAFSPLGANMNTSDGKLMGNSGSQHESTVQSQYPSVTGGSTPHGGSVQAQVRAPCTSEGSGNELPCGVAPWEKKDRIAAAEVINHKSQFSSTGDKTHDDCIMEEAEAIKGSKQSADWASRKAFPEPSRRKSHWDFVLEEMAWLANDFMQERLWKTAAAAQVARWVIKEKWQLEYQETELFHRQRKISQNLAKAVLKYWHSIDALLRKDFTQDGDTLLQSKSNNRESDGTVPMEIDLPVCGEGGKMDVDNMIMNRKKSLPVQKYAVRFLKNSVGCQLGSQAEAPVTPDRVSEAGVFDFWEDQFPEEGLFYTVPDGAMGVYRQSVWEYFQAECEQRLLDHEGVLTEADVQAAAEAAEDSAGISDFGPSTFANEGRSMTVGKRTSGSSGPRNTSVGVIPTKRMRTSAVAARQRSAGLPGSSLGLLSGSAGHLARSDISSGETNSQQDDMANLFEGSSMSGKATDVESSGAFAKNSLADGVDSPFKMKKKKKPKHFNGGLGSSAACDVGGMPFSAGKSMDSEQHWQQNAHLNEREQLKHKGEQFSQVATGSPGADGHGSTCPASHLAAANTFSANRLVQQTSNRDRGRKYKAVKAPLSQPGLGIPWCPAEDQAILGLVYELGPNWELVSDILSSSSQLKGVFRKAKDCKERHKMLTERSGGDGADSPENSSSSTPHASITGNQKGGTRFLPQHLEETLKTHVERIVQLHQQHRSRKLQTESQDQKQLVSEHPSHAVNHSGVAGGPLTPLELCEQPSSTGDMTTHPYSIQPAHGNGLTMPGMLASGAGIRLASSGVSYLHQANNLQLSPGMSPSAAINAAATRDTQRMAAASMRPLTTEEQRLRYRMVAGRGLQTQSLSVTSGLPLLGLPSPTECAVPMLSSGNSAGMMCGLSRGLPLSRTGLPAMGSPGVPNISAGMNNILPSSGMALPCTGAITSGAVPGSMNMMRRPREAVMSGRQMLIQELQQQAVQGHPKTGAALNNLNSSVSNSSTQNFSAQQPQQQLQHHNHLHQQQQNPGANQQQAYNMMRIAKERQQLQQKRMLQQQQFSANNSLQSSFQPPQSHAISNQQHALSPHSHLLPQQHQPSHSVSQQHPLPPSQPQQQPGHQQNQAGLPSVSSNMHQSGQSPSALPSLSTNIQSPQQQHTLSQTPALLSSASSALPVQTKQQHQSQPTKQPQQLQQTQQGKNSKGMGRGALPIQNISTQQPQSNMLPEQLSAQLAGQQVSHSMQGQRVFQGQGPLPSGQQLANVPQAAVGGQQNPLHAQASVQSAAMNFSQVPTAVGQQNGFSQHVPGKQRPQQQSVPISPSSTTSVQSTSPPPGSSSLQQTSQSVSPQQQSSSLTLPSMPPSQQQQQRRPSQQSQTQQRRPQQSQTSSNVGVQLVPQPGKNGLQPSPVPSQLSGQAGHIAFQLASNVNNSLGMSSAPTGIPLSSPITTSGGCMPSPQWKPGQNFSPMAAGMYNLSRSNSVAAAQAPHLTFPTGGVAVAPNGNAAVPSTGLLTRGISTGGLQQQVTTQVGGAHTQKHTGNVKAMPTSQQMASTQRQQSQQQQHSCVQSMQMTNSTGASQARPPAAVPSGITSAPELSMTRGSLAFQGNTMATPNQPVSGPMLLYNGVQHHQTHQPSAVVTQGLSGPATASTPPAIASNMAGTASITMISSIPKSPP